MKKNLSPPEFSFAVAAITLRAEFNHSFGPYSLHLYLGLKVIFSFNNIFFYISLLGGRETEKKRLRKPWVEPP